MDPPGSGRPGDGDPLDAYGDDSGSPQIVSYGSGFVHTPASSPYDDRAYNQLVCLFITTFCCLFIFIIIPLALALIAFIVAYTMLRYSVDPDVPSLT